MVPAHIATTPPAGNTPDDASPDGPCRMAARTHGFARQRVEHHVHAGTVGECSNLVHEGEGARIADEVDAKITQ